MGCWCSFRIMMADDHRYTLFDIVRMQDELAGLLARDVDLVDWGAVQESNNHIRRDEILQSAEVIYATHVAMS
jgi:predicted nucleotidyltransferase